jgi:hypothetical protein
VAVACRIGRRMKNPKVMMLGWLNEMWFALQSHRTCMEYIMEAD